MTSYELLSQLKNLFPDTHCAVSHDIRVYKNGKMEQEYTLYVADVFSSSFADFNEMKEFISNIPEQSQLKVNLA